MALVLTSEPALDSVSKVVLRHANGRQGTFVRRLSKRVMDALAKATESAEESLGNLRTVRAFSKELSEIYRYQRSVYDAFKLGRTVRLLRLAAHFC